MSLSSQHAVADALIAEMARLGARPYEEIGVPAFFVPDVPARPAEPGNRTELGTRFNELASALASRKPELDAGDVGKLVEVFADRHFPAFDSDASAQSAFSPEQLFALFAEQAPASAPQILTEMADGLARSRAIRAVNFHATPRYRAEEYRRQVDAYARAFEPITPSNFASALDGSWRYHRPGMMPMLFEGFRDNLDVLLPILEEYDFVGWFFVPPFFLGVPPKEQREFAAGHELDLPARDEYPGQRVALSWDEAREIRRRGHVFACHSRTHFKLTADTPREVLEDEIFLAKSEMESELGPGIDIFCWLGGAGLGVNPLADAMLREAGFRYLFSAFKIHQL